MFAIIKTGGKQYSIKANEFFNVEKLSGEAGEKIIFDKVLCVGEEDGNNLVLGKPYIKDKIVHAEIVKQARAKKIDVIKYKPKVRYRRKYGHRQPYTQVKILEIA